MKEISIFLLFLLFVGQSAAGPLSYVILQDSEKDSLVRVSADGKSVTTIADGAAGVGLAIDHSGNYVVAARSSLLRVTRSGVAATIAKAPSEAEWVSVAAGFDGSFVVADAKQHILWRVSEDGQSVKVFIEYPGRHSPGGTTIGLIADQSGDFLLLRLGDDNTPHLYRVTTEGTISRVPLSGAVTPPYSFQYRPRRASARAVSGGPIVSDGSGNYLFLDDEYSRNIFHLSNSGTVTKFAQLVDDKILTPTGLVTNPDNREVIVTTVRQILRISADGSTTSVLTSDPKITSAKAIIADRGD